MAPKYIVGCILISCKTLIEATYCSWLKQIGAKHAQQATRYTVYCILLSGNTHLYEQAAVHCSEVKNTKSYITAIAVDFRVIFCSRKSTVQARCI